MPIPAASLVHGDTVNGWIIERLLGSGGMSLVYLARHPRLPRLDVVKVMRPWLAEDERFKRRFVAEAERMCSLNHPNIVTVHDQGRAEDGNLYLVMQYVSGGDLRSLLTQEGRLSVDHVIAIVVQLSQALDAAHRAGLVHRDVKPENVLLEASPAAGNRVLLTDFGISHMATSTSRITQTGELLFSPAYASPEQFKVTDVDGRADQYSLACMTYELLAGVPPFDAASPHIAMKAHLFDSPPTLPSALGLASVNAVLCRALAKDPGDRWPDCTSMALALQAARKELEVPPSANSTGTQFAAQATNPVPSTAARSRRSGHLVAVAAVATTVLVASVVVGVSIAGRDRNDTKVQIPAAGPSVESGPRNPPSAQTSPSAGSRADADFIGQYSCLSIAGPFDMDVNADRTFKTTSIGEGFGVVQGTYVTESPGSDYTRFTFSVSADQEFGVGTFDPHTRMLGFFAYGSNVSCRHK